MKYLRNLILSQNLTLRSSMGFVITSKDKKCKNTVQVGGKQFFNVIIVNTTLYVPGIISEP